LPPATKPAATSHNLTRREKFFIGDRPQRIAVPVRRRRTDPAADANMLMKRRTKK
jgi:hypothetical protein